MRIHLLSTLCLLMLLPSCVVLDKRQHTMEYHSTEVLTQTTFNLPTYTTQVSVQESVSDEYETVSIVQCSPFELPPAMGLPPLPNFGMVDQDLTQAIAAYINLLRDRIIIDRAIIEEAYIAYRKTCREYNYLRPK